MLRCDTTPGYTHLLVSAGHLWILYLGLIGNVVRFLYVSWIQNPWWILPFEFVQGIQTLEIRHHSDGSFMLIHVHKLAPKPIC